jgi:hypothetical protein
MRQQRSSPLEPEGSLSSIEPGLYQPFKMKS